MPQQIQMWIMQKLQMKLQLQPLRQMQMLNQQQNKQLQIKVQAQETAIDANNGATTEEKNAGETTSSNRKTTADAAIDGAHSKCRSRSG